MRLPNKYQWWQFLKSPGRILPKKEKYIFFLFLFFSLSSLVFLSLNFYFKNTELKPAKGGIYIEGLIGSPRLINPIYAPAHDIDRDLAELIYSGLLKYNEKGELVADLAERYQIIEEGKIFEFYLKENLFWSDKTPLTAEDIIFTIEAVQKPALKSPIRASWLGVKAEKISDSAVRFELKSPSAVFLENCTLKIMPKHIWQDVSDQNFSLSAHNLEPIGSGPYKIKKINQDRKGGISSLEMTANPSYHNKAAYIPEIVFHFFENENELISAFRSKRIKGLSLISPEKYQDLKERSGFSEYRLLMPRYFALFFNPENSKLLADKKIRQALNYGTDKEEIIKILLGQGEKADSPVLPELYGFESPSNDYQFNLEEAKQLLEEAGFFEGESGLREKTIRKEPSFQFKTNLQVGSKGVEVQELQKCLANLPANKEEIYPEKEITGYFGEKTKAAIIRFQEKYKEEILTPHGLKAGTGTVLKSTQEKLNQICSPTIEEKSFLSFTLTTVSQPDQPVLTEIASLLKKQWQAFGVNLEIEAIKSNNFPEEIIRPRNYQMLLFGQMLSLTPDPFPFWHSSQTKDPGLNLSLYESKEADKLLEEARQTLDENERKILLEKFQEVLIQDAPAIFLYSQDYPYFVSKEIKGISAQVVLDPSKRFSNIEDWYIKIKRDWK